VFLQRHVHCSKNNCWWVSQYDSFKKNLEKLWGHPWSNPIYKFTTSVCDGARRSGWPSLAWAVGEGEVCYIQTQPGTLGFRSTGPDVGGGGGRGLLQTDPARLSQISTDRARRRGGEGEVCYRQTRPGTPKFRPTGPVLYINSLCLSVTGPGVTLWQSHIRQTVILISHFDAWCLKIKGVYTLPKSFGK